MIELTKKFLDMKVVRYIISGGMAAVTDLAFLFLFKDVFHWDLVISTALAFLIAFGVSFSLQKYWTFRDHSNEGVAAQGTLYFVVSGINMFVNTYLVYVFTEKWGIHYIVSQIIAAGLIALVSYFVYQKFIFNRPQAPAETL